MSKPKKLTEGHSSGPQAHWDSISDAKKDAKIERLRKLLEKALICSHSMPTTLIAAIEKEVSDA